MWGVHGLDFGFFGSGLLLPPTGSGVKLSLLQLDWIWTVCLLKKHYWLFVWLIQIHHYLATTDNQFGFKQQRGTDMCIFLLKQSVSYYVTKDTPVLSAFLDASKTAMSNPNSLLSQKVCHCLDPGPYIKPALFNRCARCTLGCTKTCVGYTTKKGSQRCITNLSH